MSPSSDAGVERVTTLVVTWRGKDHLAACLNSIAQQTEPTRLLVVDNDADAHTQRVISDFIRSGQVPATEVLRLSRNLGFAGGMARALDHVRTEFVAMLNDDAVAEPDWLAALLQALDRNPRVAAATSLLRFSADGSVNNAGVGLTSTGYGFDIGYHDDPRRHATSREVFGFSGGAALLRLADVRAIGGFPGAFFLYYEDTDTSWRLRLAGRGILYEPRAEVLHIHSASTGLQTRTFAFHNERNRLWMLIRCAPASVATIQLARFCLTTASLMRWILVGRRPQEHQLRPGLRIRVLASTARHGTALLAQRRRIRASRAQRAAVWHGRDTLS
jgi:GT2 family glycosyltransferase